MSGDISVSVAGNPCFVSFFTNTVINCQVSPSESVSNVNGTFVGSNGLRRTMFNGTQQYYASINTLNINSPLPNLIVS